MVHGITSLAEEKLFYGVWDYFSGRRENVLWHVGLLLWQKIKCFMVRRITSLAEENMFYGAWDYFSGRRENVLWCMGLLL